MMSNFWPNIKKQYVPLYLLSYLNLVVTHMLTRVKVVPYLLACAVQASFLGAKGEISISRACAQRDNRCFPRTLDKKRTNKKTNRFLPHRLFFSCM